MVSYGSSNGYAVVSYAQGYGSSTYSPTSVKSYSGGSKGCGGRCAAFGACQGWCRGG